MLSAPPAVSQAPVRDSRTLLLSQRQLGRRVWHAAQFEAEDLLLELDDAVLLAPPPVPRQQLAAVRQEVLNAARHRVGLPRKAPYAPAAQMAPTRLTTSHDLFFAVFHHPHELSYLHRLPGWRARVRHAACLLVELWSPLVALDADHLSLLREFDAVYVYNPVIGPVLQQRLGIAAPSYLPMAVDALRQAPVPQPRRVLDVYSYGRRSPTVHRALMDLVDERGLTYLYDTLGDADLRDHRDHRRLLGEMVKRSRYVMTHTINDDETRRARTGGDEGLSTRYLEAAAGGAVLLGSRPRTPRFEEAFPWPDAVVDLPWDASDVADTLADLDRQPERLSRIRWDNVRGVLSQHDWAHRWARVLQDAGLAELPGLSDRLRRLDALRAGLTAQGPTAETTT